MTETEVNSRRFFIRVDAEGALTGEYDSIYGEPSESQIEGMLEVSQAVFAEMSEFQGRRRFVDGKVVEYMPPPSIPTADDYRREIQSLIDSTAQERQYDSGATLASYVNSTTPQWSAEAQAFVAWRDAVWTYALAELDKVMSGEREQPTVEAFLAELPTFEWPE
ncbi:hypothetical protein [Brucella anthropi]|uniref:hypothetical protein n=1 Tax=Brucella anthropi TaxID=529 RepID=UPI00244B00DC|nr:hypothetical protein [Brucella anthropi]MDH0367965.1 hypothetical protein [Brucella anthropi]